MPLHFHDYASKVVPMDKLHQVLDEMNGGVEFHLTEIARDLGNLEDLTFTLGIKDRDRQGILSNNIRQQRYAVVVVYYRNKGHIWGCPYSVFLTSC